MQDTQSSKSYERRCGRQAMVATGAALFGAFVAGSFQTSAVARAAGGQGSFEPYKDARLGFALSKPDGWKVQTSEQSIMVASPDKSELMLAEMFHAGEGDTAAQWLDKLSYKYSALFPQAGLESQKQQHVKGDEVVAALHYQGPNGAAKLHVLCSIVNGKGIVYAFAAPADRFAAESPKLIHVAKSLVFTVPKGGGKHVGGSTAAPSLHWVTWKEPRQGAFTVGVPEGWQTLGGVAGGGTDEHLVVGSASPDKNISIVLGDPRLGTFTGPNQFTQRQEGHNGVLHYMRASEFNAFYLHEFVSQSIDDIQIGATKDLEELSRLATQQENQQHAGGIGNRDFEVSAGITTFTGTDKETHKPIQGGIFVMTHRGTTRMNGMQSTTWTANPETIICVAGDSNRWAIAMAATHHMEQTFREEPDWIARRRGEIQQGTDRALEATAARSKEIARQSAAAEDSIMSRYESRRQTQGATPASDDQQRGFINFIGDRTDVSDGNGHTANVGSGVGHYYRNERTGTIMGIDSAYSPGVDFTPMTEY